MDPLIKALIEQQAAEGLGNNAFARKLGVDKSTWSTARRATVPSRRSAAIFAGAMNAYPEVVRRVASRLEISNNEVSDVNQSGLVPVSEQEVA